MKSSGLILTLLVVAALHFSQPFWRTLEWKSYDLRSRLISHLHADKREASGKVVIAGIAESIALRKKPFVFWYPEIAEAVMAASRSGAKVIGLDLIPYHSLGEKLGDVTRGMKGEHDRSGLVKLGEELDRRLLAGLLTASEQAHVVQGVSGNLVPFYFGMIAHMQNIAPATLAVDVDPDGILRRQSLKREGGIERFVPKILHDLGNNGTSSEPFLLNYSLRDKIPVISFDNLIAGEIPHGRLNGKIVLIGLISSHEDVHRTPLGIMPGILIHAVALETSLSSAGLSRVDELVSLAVLLLLSTAVAVISFRFSPLTALAGAVSMDAVYLCVAFFCMANGQVFPLFPHLVAPFALFSVCYSYRYLVKERDRRKLMETFSYYVDHAVIDKLVSQDPKQLMEGERRDLAVMFVDIRNFSALTNRFGAEVVVKVLDHTFSSLTETVQEHGGFVNKLIGDGMLAFFTGSDAVDNALEAAIGICRTVREIDEQGDLTTIIQDWWLAVGVGLHFGPVVMGNIGSKRKLDFTIVGTTVNLASRIESLTKLYGRQVVVTADLMRLAGERFVFEPLGSVEVKGFDEAIDVYAVVTGYDER